MERCPHCDAATRPGAKFCTSCGTRLDDQSATQETQVSGAPVSADTTQESNSVTPEPNWAAVTADPKDPDDIVDTSASDPSIESMWGKRPIEQGEDEVVAVPVSEGSSWSSKWPENGDEPMASDSPADRFREALDIDETGSGSTETAAGEEPATPEPNRWSWSSPGSDTGSDPEESVSISPSSTPDEAATAWSWETPLNAGGESDEVPTESETITPLQDAAGFSEEGQVDSLSGDESISRDQRPTGSGLLTGSISSDTSSDDARERASALIDELRGLIWKIGEDETSIPDTDQNIISNMKRVRGETSDFSDLKSVIDAVRENPRDIDTLRDLGQKADRLQALIDSHAALTRALEDAIRQGR